MKPKSELEKVLEALPPCPKKARKWTLEEDAALMKFAESKGYEAVGRAMGLTGQQVRRRFDFLKSKMGK